MKITFESPLQLLAAYKESALNKHPRTSHPLVHRIFESFLAAGCPKPICFPRKTALGGVKRFGHGKSSSPKKVLKYSVSVPRCLVDRKQHILKALGTSFRLFTPDSAFPLNDSIIPRRYKALRPAGVEPT